MNYNEKESATKSYKEDYLKGLKNVIEKRQKEAEKLRNEYTEDIFLKQEEYRYDLKKMLGWPLVNYCNDEIPKAKAELLAEEEGYEIYRIQVEILEGLNITGLFFKQNGKGKKPLVIVQHGGMGTPELISGMYECTFNYHDLLHRVRTNDVHIFAPQLLLWDDKYDVKFDRKDIDGQLKSVGSSITAVEVYGITRIMDYFEQKEYVSSFGMAGLSYGGFYTLFAAATDTRIKSAVSCSYFNKRDAVGWADWTWFESAEKFDDAEVACLVYPRKLYIEIGDKDPLFDYKYGVESFEKLKKLCKNVGTEWVSFRVFDGNHEFCRDDEPIQKLINDMKKNMD